MRVLIITGGTFVPSEAEPWIRDFDPEWVIAADAGIEGALALGLSVDTLLGDFDSADPGILRICAERGIERRTFPAEKDDTDTELALSVAMEKAGRGGRILLLAATGSRMDHTVANLLLLKRAADEGIDCEIADGHNRIRMLKGPADVRLERLTDWPFVSLLPVFSEARGVSLEGFHYPLDRAVLPLGHTLGVSNEIEAAEGRIRFTEGYVLLFRTRD